MSYTLLTEATVTLAGLCKVCFSYLSWVKAQNLSEVQGWVRMLIWMWPEIALTLIYAKMSQRSSARNKPAMRPQVGGKGRYATCVSGRRTWSSREWDVCQVGRVRSHGFTPPYASKELNTPKCLMSPGDTIHSASRQTMSLVPSVQVLSFMAFTVPALGTLPFPVPGLQSQEIIQLSHVGLYSFFFSPPG